MRYHLSLVMCMCVLSGCGLFESEVSINRPLQPRNNTTPDQSSDLFSDDMDVVADMAVKDMPPVKDMRQRDMPTTQMDMSVVVDTPPDIPPVEDMTVEDTPPDMPVDPPVPPSDPVEQVVSRGCTTTIVKGLSQQLIDEMNCIQPGAMRSVASVPELSFYTAVFPYLQDPASRSLEQLVKGQGTLTLSSALRTLPQQYLLYRWYQLGRCNIGLAARPGRSNHNGGLAVDTPNYNAWKSRFSGNGWSWLGNSDPVHFNFNGGQDIRNLSVLALQRLWNRNNPGDQIAEDGAYGPQTESRMKQSPSMGFARGASCRAAGVVDGRDALMSLHWEGDPSTLKRVGTIAPSSVSWVEYTWNGQLLAATGRESASGQPTPNFQIEQMPAGAGTLIATGYDDEGRVLGKAVAQRLALKQGGFMLWRSEGAGLYHVQLHNTPEWVTSMALTIKGQSLNDRAEPGASTALSRVVSIRPWRGTVTLTVALSDESGRVKKRYKLPVWTE